MADHTRGAAEKDILPTILTLLTKQQRITEHTSRLVENMVVDVSRFREQSERLAIITNKLDTSRSLLRTLTRSDWIAFRMWPNSSVFWRRNANRTRTGLALSRSSLLIGSMKLSWLCSIRLKTIVRSLKP